MAFTDAVDPRDVSRWRAALAAMALMAGCDPAAVDLEDGGERVDGGARVDGGPIDGGQLDGGDPPDTGTSEEVDGGLGFDGCDDPLIRPAGWIATEESWVEAFSAPDGSLMPTYPQGLGFPVPIGAARGGYTVIAFTPTEELTVTLTWDPAQANPGRGYRMPRPAESMFIGISRCPGDLRPSDSTSANPWLQEGCRRTGGGASLSYRTFGGPSDVYVCRLEPGVVHYLTVAAVNPADGLTEGEHTCSETAPNSALGCDVQVVHSGVVR